MAIPDDQKENLMICEKCHEPITANNSGWQLAADSKGTRAYIHDNCFSIQDRDNLIRQREIEQQHAQKSQRSPKIQALGLHDTTVNYALHCNFDTYTEMLEELIVMLVHEKNIMRDQQTRCIRHNGTDCCVLLK